MAISATISGTLALEPSAHIDNITITVYYDLPNLLGLKIYGFQLKPTADGDVLISWTGTIAGEGAGFIVERSADGNSWTFLDTLNAPAKNSSPQEYQYTDTHPLAGQSYYRIVLITPGEQPFNSTVEPIYLSSTSSIRVYPNPATTYLQISNTGVGPHIQVTDAVGRICPVTFSGSSSGSATINISPLQSGLYFVRINNSAYTFLKK